MRRIFLISSQSIENHPVETALSEAGYPIHRAFEHENALRALNANPLVDLIVVDHALPEDGLWKFLSALRQDPIFHRYPVLVFSQVQGMQTALRLLELGVQHFLFGDWTTDRLLANVEKLTEPPVIENLFDDPQEIMRSVGVTSEELAHAYSRLAEEMSENLILVKGWLLKKRFGELISQFETWQRQAENLGARALVDLCEAVIGVARHEEIYETAAYANRMVAATLLLRAHASALRARGSDGISDRCASVPEPALA